MEQIQVTNTSQKVVFQLKTLDISFIHGPIILYYIILNQSIINKSRIRQPGRYDPSVLLVGGRPNNKKNHWLAADGHFRFGPDAKMFTGRKKIVKPQGQTPDEFEEQVAQELFNLEMSAAEIKAELKDLYITASKEVDVPGGRKAIVIFVPFRLLKSFHAIQTRLVRELEKKFSGRML